MSNLVPFSPPALFPSTNEIRAATPVRGPDQWQRMADAALWLNGRGSQLICSGPVGTWIAPGDTLDTNFWAWPHIANEAWYWMVTLIANGSGNANGTLQDATSSIAWTLPPKNPLTVVNTFYGANQPKVIKLLSTAGASVAGTAGNVGPSITNASDSHADVRIQAVSLVEMPRAALATVSGISVPTRDTDDSQWTINADSGNQVSVNGVCQGMVASELGAKRTILLSIAAQSGVVVTATSVGSGSSYFQKTCKIVSRNLGISGLGNSLTVRYLAQANGGSTGTIHVVTTIGTYTATFTGSTPAWHSLTITVAPEDLSSLATNGGYSGETPSIDFTRSGGTSVTIFSVCIGEA